MFIFGLIFSHCHYTVIPFEIILLLVWENGVVHSQATKQLWKVEAGNSLCKFGWVDVVLSLESPGSIGPLHIREQRGRLVFLLVHLASPSLHSDEMTVVCSQKCFQRQAAHVDLIRIPVPIQMWSLVFLHWCIKNCSVFFPLPCHGVGVPRHQCCPHRTTSGTPFSTVSGPP